MSQPQAHTFPQIDTENIDGSLPIPNEDLSLSPLINPQQCSDASIVSTGRKQSQQKQQLSRKAKLSRPKEDFWKRLRRVLPVLLLAIMLTIVLVRVDALHNLVHMGQDIQMRSSAPPEDSEVVIVMINEDDYKNIFNATSPLSATKLQELINVIAKGKPKVIGIDIATSDHQFRGFQIAEEWPPIIWVRAVFDFVPSAQPSTGLSRPVPHDVLGGKDPKLNDVNSGLPTLIDDKDSVTRFYQRMVETTNGYLPSFPWAVVKKFKPEIGEEHVATTDPLMIKFAGDAVGSHRVEFSASQVLSFAKETWWQENIEIKDKIVLLGGNYLGSDRHNTPLGEMNGLRVLSSVIEMELREGGIKRPSEIVLVPLWFLQGVMLVLVFQRFPLRNSLLQNLTLSFTLVAVTPLICSLITSRSLAYWAYFAPVAVGVLIHQLLDELNDWRKEKLESLSREISRAPTRPPRL